MVRTKSPGLSNGDYALDVDGFEEIGVVRRKRDRCGDDNHDGDDDQNGDEGGKRTKQKKGDASLMGMLSERD